MTRTAWRDPRGELVSNASLRAVAEARLAEGVSLESMQLRVSSSGDARGLARALGLTPEVRRNGKRYTRTRIWSGTAAKLCRAVGVAPVEVGL